MSWCDGVYSWCGCGLLAGGYRMLIDGDVGLMVGWLCEI